jgi:hypothetical protein
MGVEVAGSRAEHVGPELAFFAARVVYESGGELAGFLGGSSLRACSRRAAGTYPPEPMEDVSVVRRQVGPTHLTTLKDVPDHTAGAPRDHPLTPGEALEKLFIDNADRGANAANAANDDLIEGLQQRIRALRNTPSQR